MPNNSKTTWVCNSCKGKPHKANDVNIATVQSGENDSSSLTSSIQSTTCTSSIPQDLCDDADSTVDVDLSNRDSDDDHSVDQCDSDDDIQIA